MVRRMLGVQSDLAGRGTRWSLTLRTLEQRRAGTRN